MTEKEKLALLESTLDVGESVLTPETKLENVSEYDSLARLSLLVMMDEEFGVSLKPEMIKQLVTVSDILKLMEKTR